ncbi:hypothetical protein HMPREF9541_02939 [Escherichia coli MS 116-1]|nr:hypothetical protein HMPREF9541_02939 [Escherichia coli MS 116-1]
MAVPHQQEILTSYSPTLMGWVAAPKIYALQRVRWRTKDG